ncbi:hypothetical protein K438DRAFT_2110716 [Mycena galopus ATCC 62051]|nr:hypothetical protein K438DRAFT_2110716 [Mycena galopus ATCC 62051]
MYPAAPVAATAQNIVPLAAPVIKEESLSYQWPDGNVKLECTTDQEPVGWDDQGWTWRSSGSRKQGLPAADRAALDKQVRENPQLTAQQLRAGAGPTQIPLGEINSILLGSRKACSEVERSKARQGILQPAGTRNSGFQLLDSLSTLKDSFETPWIAKSDIMDSRYIVMQTPFMREVLLQDQVRSWRQEILVAEGGRHGVVTDGCHNFFKQGILLISWVFSQVLMCWSPVQYTWLGEMDTAHHKAHFDQLVCVIAEMCTRGLGYEFDDRLYSAVNCSFSIRLRYV